MPRMKEQGITAQQICEAAEKAGLDLVEFFGNMPRGEDERIRELIAWGHVRTLMQEGLTSEQIGRLAGAFVSLEDSQRDALIKSCQIVAGTMRRREGE